MLIRLGTTLAVFVFLLMVHASRVVGRFLSIFRRRVSSSSSGLRVLAMGTFYHRNWYESHLKPLASADAVDTLLVVTGQEGVAMDGVQWCVAPLWLRRLLRRHGARLVWSFVMVWRHKPDVIVGYFICPSALWGLALGQFFGVKTVYQVCGGPREFTRCGSESDNVLLKHMIPGFPFLGRLLYDAIGAFDMIVVRGAKAVAFFEEHFSGSRVCVIPGSVDPDRFRAGQTGQNGAAIYDVMTACRLAPVKRLEMLLEATAKVVEMRPETRVVIVGDGPERDGLEALSERTGLSDHVSFVGVQNDVERFHHESRIYVMTSRDEGLSIALAEAMASGLPAIVTDVGELGELVKDGRNGFLVPSGDADSLADRLLELLSADDMRKSMATRAAEDAFETCGLPRVADRWNRALKELVG